MFLSESCCFPLFVKGESLMSVSIVNLQKNGYGGISAGDIPSYRHNQQCSSASAFAVLS